MRLFDEAHGCMEKYLEVKIGIPASFYPTFLGLSLAEDFELGTRYINHGTSNMSIYSHETSKDKLPEA